MSEIRQMLLDATERLLSDYCTKELVFAAERGVWAKTLWDALAEAGITNAVAPQDTGGCDLELGEALLLAGLASRFSAPIPVGENFLAGSFILRAGMQWEEGPMTIAPTNLRDQLVLEREHGHWRLTGLAKRVPWARNARKIVASATFRNTDMIAIVPPDGYTIDSKANIAAEPRDTVRFDALLSDDAVSVAPERFGRMQQHAMGAALRTVQIASALDRVLDITVNYARDRVQFGRPITKFQAVQHNLAVLASQAAAANAAADIAIESVGIEVDLLNIASVKVRAGEASSVGTSIAHQVHGAIGMTHEYELNLSTRRLWSWRDEFGNEVEWSMFIGRKICEGGAAELWPTITRAGLSGLVQKEI